MSAGQRLTGVEGRLSFACDNRFIGRITLHYAELTGYWQIPRNAIKQDQARRL